MTTAFPLADLALSQRLERAEAVSNARYVEARSAVMPERGAMWIEVAGARAMFDGVSSPLTQTFGLGLFQPATPADLDAIEAFYAGRGAPVFHEVSPLADPGLPALLSGRGYRPIEFTSVLYQPLAGGPQMTRVAKGDVAQRVGPEVRAVSKTEERLHAEVAAAGWAEFGVSDFLRDIGRINGSVEGLHLFLAELGGQAIAAGAMNIVDGVALLAGASTMPGGRRQGAQLALLDHRLRFAADRGCDLAMMGALPGGGSQRNAERNGFRIAYTRIKWGR
jgi:hypothetical protein